MGQPLLGIIWRFERRSAQDLTDSFQKAPRCSATSKRTHERCKAPAVRGWTVCRFHGARGGGPKGKRNGMFKHGLDTKEAVKERRLPPRASSTIAQNAEPVAERALKTDGNPCESAPMSVLVPSDKLDENTAAAISAVSQSSNGGVRIKMHNKLAAKANDRALTPACDSLRNSTRRKQRTRIGAIRSPRKTSIKPVVLERNTSERVRISGRKRTGPRLRCRRSFCLS
jgi:hypothetical protein